MDKIWQVIKNHWITALSNLITAIITALNLINLDISNELSVYLKASLVISLTLSITLNIKIAVNYQKTVNTLNSQITINKSIIQNYEIQLKSTVVNNYGAIDLEIPYLAISQVPYTISNSLFPVQHDDDAVQYVDDTVIEISGSTYYVYVNDTKILFSLDKEKIIKDYFHDTTQTIKLDNGIGVTSKPRHLFIFKLINVSDKAVLAMVPMIMIDKSENTYKGVTAQVLKPNNEILFVVLFELHGKNTRNYSMEFQFSYKGKRYKQSFPIKLVGGMLTCELLLSEPKELPQVVES